MFCCHGYPAEEFEIPLQIFQSVELKKLRVAKKNIKI